MGIMSTKTTLKERIRREMMSGTDRLIGEILSEYTNFTYGEIKRYAEKIIREECDKCLKVNCPHKYKPSLSEDLNKIECFRREHGS